MAKKKFDPKAKAKRQKIFAAVGGVLLLALLAFQVPRTMKMLNQKPPEEPVPVAAPTAVPSDPSVLPTPGSAGGSTSTPAGSPSSGTLISSDLAPSPQAGQLIAFGRFSSKDPFKQQVDPNRLGGGGGSSGSSSGGKKSGPAPDGGVVTPGSSGGGSKPTTPTSPTSPTTPGSTTVPAGSALISVNGTEEAVAVKANFPAADPVFTLVSLSKAGAKIAIAGGAFASGQPTIALKLGKSISLVNTADGTRFELKLVAVG